MILTRLSYFVNGKVFEWVMTLNCIGLAMEIFFWPETSKSGVFFWVNPYLQGAAVGFIFTFLGTARVIGMLLNGHSIKIKGEEVRLGPWIRALASVLSAFIWSQFVVGLTQLSVTQGYPSPGIPLWLSVTLAEVYIAYRTVANAR